MQKFITLIVDDDEEIRQIVENNFSDNKYITIHTASSLKEAEKKIKECFFHLALVDIQLKKGQTKNIDGITVLRILADTRPTCLRIVLSQHISKYSIDFLNLLVPPNPLINGALDKTNFKTYYMNVINDYANTWLSKQVRIGNISKILSNIFTKKIKINQIKITEEEIDYCISKLFGQGELVRKIHEKPIFNISLQPLSGGRSRSVVARSRIKNRDRNLGIWCVIKIGLKEEIFEEFDRYSKYVKYFVSLNRRVELLGFSLADGLGGICYSFAGKSPKSVKELYQYFREKDPKTVNYIETLMNLQEDERLYGNTIKQDDLGGFFSSAYKLDIPRILEYLENYYSKLAEKFGGRYNGYEIIIQGTKILSPKLVIGKGVFHRSFLSCVVHGDMNAMNVIVGDDGRIILIDFRYTGWGPASIDFAALEVSLRLAISKGTMTHRQLLNDMKNEKYIWDSVWKCKEIKSTKLPFWVETSISIGNYCRKNFPEIEPEEYAMTCLLCCLRLVRISGLADNQRLKIINWISFLVTTINN